MSADRATRLWRGGAPAMRRRLGRVLVAAVSGSFVCRASRCLLSACSLAARCSFVGPSGFRPTPGLRCRAPALVRDSASRIGSFVRASRRHVDLPGVHTFCPDRAFRWCAHLPVPGVHAVPAFPQGKINNLATLLGGRSAILVFLSWGPRGDPKRGVHTFLAHGPFGWGPGTFALANWSPENALASWCAHSASRCARAHQTGVRPWDELPRFCSSGRGCRGRESGLGTQLGLHDPPSVHTRLSMVCTLGFGRFRHFGVDFRLLPAILPVGRFADAGSGGSHGGSR